MKPKEMDNLLKQHGYAFVDGCLCPCWNGSFSKLGGLHEFVRHMEKYVNGQVHTNGLENFWSLLKRGLGGTYVAVEPFHLFRCVDEQAFRYNNRTDERGNKLTDAERFKTVASQIVGKRLTFKEVTGKVGETSF